MEPETCQNHTARGKAANPGSTSYSEGRSATPQPGSHILLHPVGYSQTGSRWSCLHRAQLTRLSKKKCARLSGGALAACFRLSSRLRLRLQRSDSYKTLEVATKIEVCGGTPRMQSTQKSLICFFRTLLVLTWTTNWRWIRPLPNRPGLLSRRF